MNNVSQQQEKIYFGLDISQKTIEIFVERLWSRYSDSNSGMQNAIHYAARQKQRIIAGLRFRIGFWIPGECKRLIE